MASGVRHPMWLSGRSPDRRRNCMRAGLHQAGVARRARHSAAATFVLLILGTLGIPPALVCWGRLPVPLPGATGLVYQWSGSSRRLPRAAEGGEGATSGSVAMDRREVVAGLLARSALFGFWVACFLPAGRGTDTYRWAIAQLEALDADAIPGTQDAALIARAVAAAACPAGAPTRVLDLGAGTGGDLRYLLEANLPGPLEVLAADPNTFTWPKAEEQARRLGLGVASGGSTSSADNSTVGMLSFVQDVAAVPTGSVSLVLARRVLCSVDDPQAVLREVYRALRPGGVFVFIEHVAARQGTLLRNFQQLWKPVQQAFANGCDPARDTQISIRESCAWASVEMEPFALENGGPIAPHIRGFAVK